MKPALKKPVSSQPQKVKPEAPVEVPQIEIEVEDFFEIERMKLKYWKTAYLNPL